MRKSKLPDTLGETILLALKDEAAVYKNPLYDFDMSSWHKPNGVCSVCFAGAVMVGTFKADIEQSFDPSDFGVDEYKLEALDDIRIGNIKTAVDKFYNRNSIQQCESVTPHEDDRTQWRKDMRKIAKTLIKVGL